MIIFVSNLKNCELRFGASIRDINHDDDVISDITTKTTMLWEVSGVFVISAYAQPSTALEIESKWLPDNSVKITEVVNMDDSEITPYHTNFKLENQASNKSISSKVYIQKSNILLNLIIFMVPGIQIQSVKMNGQKFLFLRNFH